MRYLVQFFVEKGATTTFPWGTFIANVAGSFIIGVVFALAEKGNLMSSELRLFFAVGICGGFTTFSSFAYNNFTMIKEHSFGQLLWNVGGSLFFGILAIYIGVLVVKTIF
jgi:CrcB protein